MPFLSIFYPEKPSLPHFREWYEFLRTITNYMINGHCRYGEPKKTQLYLDSLTEELKRYKRSGNREHLINIAVYCWLEMVAPQHNNHHWKDTEKSATAWHRKIT